MLSYCYIILLFRNTIPALLQSQEAYDIGIMHD